MRGITAIISVILLLMIAIAITGFAYFFLIGTVQTATNETSTQLEKQTSSFGENFAVENVNGYQVYIRNRGNTPLPKSSLSFYLNNTNIEIISGNDVPPNSVGVFTLNETKISSMGNAGTLKISSSGYYEEKNVVFNETVKKCVQPSDCYTSNLCKTYSCVNNACVYSGISCDDGNACTINNCNPATGCDYTTPTNCDDYDSCTTDSCNPASGCINTPTQCCGNGVVESGEACDKGPPLNVSGTCQNYGYESGQLNCMPDCLAINYSDCVSYPAQPSLTINTPEDGSVLKQDFLLNVSCVNAATVNYSINGATAINMNSPYTATISINSLDYGMNKMNVSCWNLLGINSSITEIERRDVFFGDLHMHSNLSFDVGGQYWNTTQGKCLPKIKEYTFSSSPSMVYSACRDYAKADFCVLSEHDVSHTDCPDGMNIDKWRNLSYWANYYYRENKFVTFLGLEWSAIPSKPNDFNGHIAWYLPNTNVANYCSLDNANCDTASELNAYLSANGGISHVAHPGAGGESTGGVNYAVINENFQRNIEVMNDDGIYFNNKTLAPYPIFNLNKKFGFVTASDSHTGLYNTTAYYPAYFGLTACWADNLSRQAVFDALKNRRCYATTGTRIIVNFTINGYPLGSEISASSNPIITVIVNGTDTIKLINITKNNTQLAIKTDCASKNCRFDYTDTSFNSNSIYYVIVQQVNNTRQIVGDFITRPPPVMFLINQTAWVSPIWVTKVP